MRRATVVVAALVSSALALAACGSSQGPGVARLSPGGATSAHQSELRSGFGPLGGIAIPQGTGKRVIAFSACMRAHGVPGYPDPNGAGEVSLGTIDVASATFLAAARVCATNLPYMNLPPPDPKDTARLIAQDVRFAACMHRHAFPQYPEPQLVHGRDLLQLGGPGMNMQLSAVQAGGRELLLDVAGRDRGA